MNFFAFALALAGLVLAWCLRGWHRHAHILAWCLRGWQKVHPHLQSRRRLQLYGWLPLHCSHFTNTLSNVHCNDCSTIVRLRTCGTFEAVQCWLSSMSNDKTRCSSLVRLGAYRYGAPYKQLVPNQCLTFNHAMSRPGLSDGSCILLISNETPSAGCQWLAILLLSERWRYTETWQHPWVPWPRDALPWFLSGPEQEGTWSLLKREKRIRF